LVVIIINIIVKMSDSNEFQGGVEEAVPLVVFNE
jgi:hypothetical protein